MSDLLAARGIPIRQGWDPINLDEPAPDLVIIGNAIRRDNPEAVATLERDLAYTSFPEAMGELFLAHRKPIVITGTHGKTTTTGLAAWLFGQTGRQPGFLVGGVLPDLGTSHELGTEGGPFIIEGDEYDTAFFEKTAKFLHYRPHTAVLTSVEFDHADIYADLAAIEDAFERFVRLLPDDGRLLVCADHDAPGRIAQACSASVETYGVSEGADWRGLRVDAGPTGMRFDLLHRGQNVATFETRLTGDHNLANITAALALAIHEGADIDELRDALARFGGVKRRQELIGEVNGFAVIDDFAHHPTAVKATIAAIREQYPERPLRVIFEPRSNTTVRSFFQDRYTDALSDADAVDIAPIHRPHLVPEDDRLNIERLAADLCQHGVDAHAHPEGVDSIIEHTAENARDGEVMLVLSNGAFGGIHNRLLETLRGVHR